MHKSALEIFMPYIVIFNFALVAVFLIVLGRIIMKDKLTDGVPGSRQNVGEWILDFFVGRARELGDTHVVKIVAPFIATLFLFILGSNLLGMLPIPLLNNPPTAYYSGPLGLAICAVLGTFVVSAALNGIGGALKHLVWPNPLQLIGEVTDVLSLSLRLFGNIGGEHMTLVLVMSTSAFIGIPLILHVLGLIPAFVQALVFTLLTTSFVAGVVHKEHEESEEEVEYQEKGVVEAEARESVIGGHAGLEGEPAQGTVSSEASNGAVQANKQVF